MAKFETLEVAGWMPALEGMRAPLKSYDKSDIVFDDNKIPVFDSSNNDYLLAKRLCLAGTEHSKWMRQVQVWVKISAPLFWWSEFDTYKVGTSANSESTMHTITKRLLTIDDFETNESIYLNHVMGLVNDLIVQYQMVAEENDKNAMQALFISIKCLLPASFIQTRYVNLNYAVLQNMYKQRKNHRLPQWRDDFINWVKTLPYSEFITGEFDTQEKI